ncbi:universal stress protein [Bdellovibrionota bacterium]
MERVKKILVPTDFSAATKDVLDFVIEVAKPFQSEVTLLHVTETSDPYAEPPMFYSDREFFETQASSLKEEIEALLNKYKDILEKEGIENVKLDFITGNPFVEIVKYTEKLDCDLVAIGSHGQTDLEHVFLGSVAEQVVRNATCPVVTIKKRGFKFKPVWQK